MSELLTQLGIDWKLLLSQAVNFGLLLIILRLFVYKPVLKILEDRKTRIEEGLTKAAEADERLKNVEIDVKEKLKETDRKAMGILKEAENKAKEREARLLIEAKKKESAIFSNAESIIEAKAEEARAVMREEAASVVKSAIARTVELDPKAIDEALIKKAVEGMK